MQKIIHQILNHPIFCSFHCHNNFLSIEKNLGAKNFKGLCFSYCKWDTCNNFIPFKANGCFTLQDRDANGRPNNIALEGRDFQWDAGLGFRIRTQNVGQVLDLGLGPDPGQQLKIWQPGQPEP